MNGLLSRKPTLASLNQTKPIPCEKYVPQAIYNSSILSKSTIVNETTFESEVSYKIEKHKMPCTVSADVTDLLSQYSSVSSQLKMKYLFFKEILNTTQDVDMIYILGEFLSNENFISCMLIDFETYFRHLNAKYYDEYYDISVSYINQQFRLALLPIFITPNRINMLNISNINYCQKPRPMQFLYTLPCRNAEPQINININNLTEIDIIYNVDSNLSIYGPHYGSYNFIKKKIFKLQLHENVETDAINVYVFKQDDNYLSQISVIGYNTKYGGLQTFQIKFQAKMIQSILELRDLCIKEIK